MSTTCKHRPYRATEEKGKIILPTNKEVEEFGRPEGRYSGPILGILAAGFHPEGPAIEIYEVDVDL